MDTTIEGLRKALDSGTLAHVTRASWHKGLQQRAEAIRKANETPEQAYARAVMHDDIGKLLFRGHQNASLLKSAPASGFAGAGEPKGVADSPEKEMGLGLIGPAHKEMHALAIDHQRARGNTYAQAYSHVYSHRDNEALRNRVKAEHLAMVSKSTGIM